MQFNVLYLALGGALPMAEVYPNSTLYKHSEDSEEMEALQLGAVQRDMESRIGKTTIDAVDTESAALGAR